MLSSVRKRLREHIETLPRPFTVELSPVETRLVQVAQQRADPIRTIRERLDAAALLSGHKAVWDAIGISRSNYFEVKAGRGGRKAKAKTDLYLSRLERNVKDANLN